MVNSACLIRGKGQRKPNESLRFLPRGAFGERLDVPGASFSAATGAAAAFSTCSTLNGI